MGWCTLQWQTYSKMICLSITRFNSLEPSHFCDRFITWLVILRLPIYTIWYRRRRWSLCVSVQFCIKSGNGPFPRPRPWWVAPRVSRSATFHVDFWSCSYGYNFICFLVVHVGLPVRNVFERCTAPSSCGGHDCWPQCRVNDHGDILLTTKYKTKRTMVVWSYNVLKHLVNDYLWNFLSRSVFILYLS